MSSFNFRTGGCVWCHAGGGAMEYDRMGYRYDGIDGGAPGKVGPNPDRATRYGDYYVFDPSSTSPPPNEYGLVSKVGAATKGVAEVDCLMCHLNGSYNNEARNYCGTSTGAGSTAFAPNLGPTMGLTRTLLVTTTERGTSAGGNPSCDYTYGDAGAGAGIIPAAMIATTPRKEACGTCHFPDVSKPNGVGPAGNPLDFTTFQKHIKAAPDGISCSKNEDCPSGTFCDSDTGACNTTTYDLAKGRAEFGKRGESINDSTFNPDAHMDAGLVCADCHYNVSGGFDAVMHGTDVIADGVTVKTIDHQFAKGNNRPDGKNMDQLDNTVTCESCHITREHPKAGSAPIPTHVAIPPLHFDRVDCRTCHIPTLNFVKKQLVTDFSTVPYPMDAGFESGQFLIGPAGTRSAGRIGYKPLYLWQDRGHHGADLMLAPIAIGTTAIWKDISSGLPYSKRFATAAAKNLRSQKGGGTAWPLNSPQGGDTALIVNTTEELTRMASILKGTSGSLAEAFLLDEPTMNLYVNQFTVSHNVAKKENALGGPNTGCAICHSESSAMFANPAQVDLGDVAGWKGQVFLQPNEGGLQMTCDDGDCENGTKRINASVTVPCPGGSKKVIDLTAGVAHGDPVKNFIPQEEVLCYSANQLATLKQPRTSTYFAGLDSAFTWQSGVENLKVGLDASASKCPTSASGCSYTWNCGETGVSATDGLNSFCQYTTAGDHPVTLTVTDLDAGYFDTSSQTVNAKEVTGPVAPSVDNHWDAGTRTLQVFVTGSINRAQVYWGDGTSNLVYSATTLSHTYTVPTPKSYTCKVYVYDKNNVRKIYSIPVSY